MSATPPPARAAELFDALVELSPADADARLAKDCAGDAELEGAVRALLHHHHQADPRFLAPVAERAALGEAPTVAMRVSARKALAPASRLGRYHVLHKLGEGGMGSVYVGYDEGLDRKVALKVLHRGTATHDWLLREGQALGRLAHPNVVSLYEVGQEGDSVFLAMELVDGASLREWLLDEPRSFTQILRLFLQAGRGLSAVHRAGLVHRDFKLENVLVGHDGRARVADFGIATLSSRTETPPPVTPGASAKPLDRALTDAGMLLGTPSFMSPEQFQGQRATPRSDQWSFAVGLYNAVYEDWPFPGETLAELSQQVTTDAPAVPKRRADAPSWLWPILDRALSREPAARYPDMDALLAAIQAHLPRDPDLDPTVTARERAAMTVLFGTAYLAQAILLGVPRTAEWMCSPAALFGIPALMVGAYAVNSLWRWKQLARNAYGRSLALVFPSIPAALLLHRFVATRLGLPGPQVLVDDAALLAAAYTGLALGEHRWLAWVAGLSALGSLGGALWPAQALPIIGAKCAAVALAVGVRAYLDRDIDPGAAVGPIERD